MAQSHKSNRYHVPPNVDVADAIVELPHATKDNSIRPLPPDFTDWPQQIQDELFLAAETLSQNTGKQYILYHCICEYDEDNGWYVHAVCIHMHNGQIQLPGLH